MLPRLALQNSVENTLAPHPERKESRCGGRSGGSHPGCSVLALFQAVLQRSSTVKLPKTPRGPRLDSALDSLSSGEYSLSLASCDVLEPEVRATVAAIPSAPGGVPALSVLGRGKLGVEELAQCVAEQDRVLWGHRQGGRGRIRPPSAYLLWIV